LGVHVPQPIEFVDTKTDLGKQWWEEQGRRFPDANEKMADALIMERVFPIPKIVRHAIVDNFAVKKSNIPPQVAESIKKDTAQKHSLIRVYLGRESGPLMKGGAHGGTQLSLRNFPLHLGAAKELSLDVEKMAEAMGAAIAILHWGAGLSGEDVEFVLGTKMTIKQDDHTDFQHREICLFLIDFGRCKAFPRGRNQIRNFGHGMLDNDPYYPSPDNPELFKVFSESYVRTSRNVLLAEGLDINLGQMVIDGVLAYWKSLS